MDDMTRRYVDDGYLVVQDLIEGPVVQALRDEVTAFARGRYPVRGIPSLRPETSDDEAMRSVLAVHFPHWTSAVVRDAVTHPTVAEVLRHIVGAHLPHWDGAVKCMQSMLFVKGPGMPGQAWHQDERFIATRDRSLVGAWIALDDATVENGCLWVVPGSHRNGYLWPFRPHGRPEEFDPTDEAYGFDDGDAVPVEVRAGSVVFFNGYLLHRSLANRSSAYRRALVNHYCNAWSLLPWSPLGGEVPAWTIATMDYRNVVALGDDPYGDRPTTGGEHRAFVRPHVGSWEGDVGADPAG
jgi:phytanoyl-CoA hydroxylase